MIQAAIVFGVSFTLGSFVQFLMGWGRVYQTACLFMFSIGLAVATFVKVH